jgi:methylenetetrahydrofolate dehydrogenase (NADP+) / methenyltetrahydrofolate cyclohydrolase
VRLAGGRDGHGRSGFRQAFTVLRVTAVLMDGRSLAARVRAGVAGDVRALGAIGLATVLVGDDPASHVYITAKHKAAQEAGIETRDLRLPAHTAEAEVLATISELNDDGAVHGILVQLPLPGHIDEGAVTRAVAPVKDVDGLHPMNAGYLYLGVPLHVPATPAGCLELLDAYGIDPAGREAVVIGRSELVGRPAAMMLLQRHATVTMCHSRTADLAAHCRRADIIVAAVGVPGLVRPEMVKPGATLLDVGLTRGEDGIVGDVDPAVSEVAGHLTPMPGGTGPMTIAMLLRSTVKAARFLRGDLAFPGR